MEQVYVYIFGFIMLCILIYIISQYNNNPIKKPVIKVYIDVSGRRQTSITDLVDQWLIDHQGTDVRALYNQRLNIWVENSEYLLSKLILWRKHRVDQFCNMRNSVEQPSYEMFKFTFTRKQTRYIQRNYRKSAYQVSVVDHVESFTVNQLSAIQQQLRDIGFETTREKYFSQNQRKLMTKALRKKIMIRDNFTCRNCGKYMPDEVGLHIDHIVAIKNGGKTVESNLQVLCDKCNLSKGSRKRVFE